MAGDNSEVTALVNHNGMVLDNQIYYDFEYLFYYEDSKCQAEIAFCVDCSESKFFKKNYICCNLAIYCFHSVHRN